MRLTFYGAARTVTGSQHMVEVNGKRILLDCGSYQGRRAEAFERNRVLPFDPRSLDAVILSHAHIDHSGNLPNLVKSGYSGEIIATHATRDLCASMLLDSGNIQERDAEYTNKKRLKRGEAPIEPIYTQADANKSVRSFSTINYDRPHQVVPGVTLTFKDAGHMLGSAFVILDIEDQAAHRDVRLVFSGDLGRAGIPIIRDPEPLDTADFLIMESTYGDRLHPPFEDDAVRMAQIINDTHQRGGSIIIPAFAVGRTQQVVFALHQLTAAGKIPHMPVFVDSPLATDVTAAYRTHPECFDSETMAFLEANSLTGRDPFGFSDLHYTRTTDESKQLNTMQQPIIIVAPSGMAEHGRVLHHLKNRIEDPKHTVLIVGWQAENTLGRRLVEHAPEVRIFGETYQNRAQCEVLNGFSGHAGQDELIAWVGGVSQKPKQTFLVHGELPAQTTLAGMLKEQYGLRVEIPEWKQSFEV